MASTKQRYWHVLVTCDYVSGSWWFRDFQTFRIWTHCAQCIVHSCTCLWAHFNCFLWSFVHTWFCQTRFRYLSSGKCFSCTFNRKCWVLLWLDCTATRSQLAWTIIHVLFRLISSFLHIFNMMHIIVDKSSRYTFSPESFVNMTLSDFVSNIFLKIFDFTELHNKYRK